MRNDYPLGCNLCGFIKSKAKGLPEPNLSSLIKGWIHHCRFLCWFTTSQQEQARQELEKIAALPDLPVAVELEYLFDVCNLANQFSLWDNMAPALDRLEEVSRDGGYQLGLAQSEYFRAVLLINDGNYQEAIGRYRSAIGYVQKAGDRNLEADILNDMGFCHRRIGDGRKAMEFYRESLLLREQTGNLAGQAESLNNIGLALCEQKEHLKADKCLKQALAIEEKIGDKLGIGYTLVNLGFLAGHLKDLPGEEKRYLRALEIRQEIGDNLGLGYCYLRLAHLAHRDRDQKKTLTLLDQAAESFTKAKDSCGQIEARLHKTQYLLEYREVAGAREVLTGLAPMMKEQASEGQNKRYRDFQARLDQAYPDR